MRALTVDSGRFLGAILISLAPLAMAQQPAPPADAEPKLLATFQAAGRSAPLTVYPASLVGQPVPQVGEVVAMMLERAGMSNLEVDAPEFKPPEKAEFPEIAKAFGEFVRSNPPKTDYALLADFRGTPGKSVDSVGTVVVDRQGRIVWQDCQSPTDADFKRIAPHEPLECCQLVVERLRPLLKLDDPQRENAPEGRLARRWNQRTGVPDKAEQDAMPERQRQFKQAAATATVLIYPAHGGDEWSAESAAHLVTLLSEAKLTRPTAARQGPQPDVKGDMNEQKVLWAMARGVREYVQAHRPDADYVLYADYLMGKNRAGQSVVGGVHFVICDREGRWVIVDFQNSHHPDFNAIKPTSRVDCDALVAQRLAGYCK